MWQIMNGIHYLHSNWVLHRDLKPANILIMGPDSPEHGRVKIADLGMARLFNAPLKPLSHVDPVVVTFWYRAPELLMASKHYTKAVDIWAIGCIMAELMTSKPMFYTKHADKSKDPYHVDQLREIIRIMGIPISVDGKPKDPSREWQGMNQLPKYKKLQQDFPINNIPPHIGLETYLRQKSPSLQRGPERTAQTKLALLVSLLRMDPQLRLSAESALDTPYFKEEAFSKVNIFAGLPDQDAYPKREYKVQEEKVTKKGGTGVYTSKPHFPARKKRAATDEEGGVDSGIHAPPLKKGPTATKF
jgi:cyclin-dependent kinase 8/11